jgi:hypothetical protein
VVLTAAHILPPDLAVVGRANLGAIARIPASAA